MSKKPARKKQQPSTASHREFETLYLHAKKYLSRAHSPYSGVRVASAVLMTNGKIYGGCNIENASYGGTICAERVAITKAISESGNRVKIKSILVTTNQSPVWPPCGLCRQVIAEFCTPQTTVHMTNKSGQHVPALFRDLFPGAFDSSFLK